MMTFPSGVEVLPVPRSTRRLPFSSSRRSPGPAQATRALPLLRDFSRARALACAREFEEAVYEGTWRKERARDNRNATGAATDALYRHEIMSSHFRPNRRTARYFFLSKVCLAETPWIPARSADAKIVEKLVNHQCSWDYDRQLDYFPHDDLVKEFEAHEARRKLAHVDLILAAHRVTTRAFMNLDYQDRFADGLERRTYCFREPGDMGGAICGVMEVRPRLVGSTLQVRFRLHHDGYYHATNFISANSPLSEFRIHPYMVDGGRALIGAVRARSGDRTFPAAFRTTQPDGSLLYEVELPRPDLAGVYLEVDARFVAQSHPLVFDLFTSECARRRTRLAAAAAEKDAAAAAAPARPEAWIEAGYAHQATGALREAMKRYRKAIDLAPRRQDAYLIAAEMYRRHGQHRQAADLLRALADADPAQADNWHNLAAELYLAEAYAEAARACAKALEVRPGHVDARVLQAVSSYLAGDRAAASRLLEGLPDGAPRDRTVCLRLLSDRTREGAVAADVETVFAALHDRLDDGPRKALLGLLLQRTALAEALKVCTTPADQCRAHCYAGYRAVFDGNTTAAGEQFTKAVEVGPSPHQLERRMAAIELAKLQRP